jgi:hypothetical protein
MDNLFAGLSRSTAENEQFRELLARPGLRIERIVSTGQASPAVQSGWRSIIRPEIHRVDSSAARGVGERIQRRPSKPK